MSPWIRLLAGVGLVSERAVQAIDRPKEPPRTLMTGDYGVAPTVDPLHTMSAIARFALVYSVIEARATDAASVPLVAVRGRGASRERLDQHPILDLIQKPSTSISGRLLAMQLTADRILSGNSYGLLIGARDVVSVLRLHPEYMRAVVSSWGSVEAWDYQASGGVTRYSPEAVAHMRSISWESDARGVYGQGMIQALADELSAELAAIQRETASQNLGRPAIIATPRATGDEYTAGPPSTPAAIRELEARLNKAFERQTGKVAYMDRDLELHAPGWRPDEMASEELHARVQSRILSASGVPPVRVGIETANYATAREQLAMYWESTVGSDVRHLCDLWTQVAQRMDPRLTVEPDWSGVRATQVDRTERIQRVISHVMLGMQPADAYAYEGLADAPVISDSPPPAAGAPNASADPTPAAGAAEEPARSWAAWMRMSDDNPERAAAWSQRMGGVKIVRLERSLYLGVQRALKAQAEAAAKAAGEALGKRSAKGWTRAEGDDAAAAVPDDPMRDVFSSWVPRALSIGWANGAPDVGMTEPYRPRPVAEQATVARAVTQVDETTRQAVRDAVTAGIDAGESVNEIQARIMRDPAFSADRALLIARTETTGTVNDGTQLAYTEAEEDGLELERVWLSSRDGFVRDTHRAMDGQAATDGVFTSPSGATGRAPGRMSTAAESCNCRCTITARVKG